MFTIITSRISKLSSVFDKLGVGSKYREGTAFQHSKWKNKCNVSGDTQIIVTAAITILNQAEKRGKETTEIQASLQYVIYFVSISFYKNYVIIVILFILIILIYVFIFRDFPGRSGMFRVPGLVNSQPNGSFENESLENEAKTEARSTQIPKPL